MKKLLIAFSAFLVLAGAVLVPVALVNAQATYDINDNGIIDANDTTGTTTANDPNLPDAGFGPEDDESISNGFTLAVVLGVLTASSVAAFLMRKEELSQA